MKFRIGEGSKARGIPFALPRARKRNPNNGGGGGGGGGGSGSTRDSLRSDAGFRSLDSGSKDDAFFESRPWLDSDCEDDFFSVNGDFTPSRGSTPNHHFATPRQSQAYKSSPLGPNDRKQKLSELLNENQESEEDGTKKNAADGTTKNGVKIEDHNLETSSSVSREVSPNIATKNKKEREFKSQCCLPNFSRTLSYKERRKPKMSPTQ